MTSEPTVFLVDDDPAIRDALTCLAEVAGLRIETYPSAAEFLEALHIDPDRTGCLVADLRMARMSGLELCDHLVEKGVHLPTIIMSGHTDARDVVAASGHAGIQFVRKPFRPSEMLDRIRESLDQKC